MYVCHPHPSHPSVKTDFLSFQRYSICTQANMYMFSYPPFYTKDIYTIYTIVYLAFCHLRLLSNWFVSIHKELYYYYYYYWSIPSYGSTYIYQPLNELILFLGLIWPFKLRESVILSLFLRMKYFIKWEIAFCDRNLFELPQLPF